jgi:hypothetical protein
MPSSEILAEHRVVDGTGILNQDEWAGAAKAHRLRVDEEEYAA